MYQLDLVSDLRQMCDTALSSKYGIANHKRDSISFFIEIAQRRVSPERRTVHLSAELKSRPAFAARRDAILAVQGELENGVDVSARLSNTIWDSPERPDMMLLDWGIHHLHLGKIVAQPTSKPRRPSDFAERTGEQLYVMLQPGNAYLIDIQDHVFDDEDIIQIVHNNWPEVLKPHRYVGAPSKRFTRAERANLRRNGFGAILTLSDGTTYFPVGGGYSAAKTSWPAQIAAVKVVRRLSEIQEAILASVQQPAETIELRLSGAPFGMWTVVERH